MENLLQETNQVIEEICEKYNYGCEDMEGNDSLRTVLLKAVPAMLANSPKEDRELFYQMLRHTPIVITEKLTQEGNDALVDKYIGNVNPHVVEENLDLGEYGKGVAPAAYVSEPIIDENMQVKGKKSFVYVQKVLPKEKEFFGTDIHVSHLIHELGHAWHAEDRQFVISEDEKLIERVGTAQFIYSLTKRCDGKIVKRQEAVNGLFIEEGMNTLEEEKAMANYMGISQEEMNFFYEKVLVSSDYQGSISYVVKDLMDKTSSQDLKSWRLHGDKKAKRSVENLLEKTEEWQNREEMALCDQTEKRKIIERIDSVRIQEIFEKYKEDYFPNVLSMKPLQRIDNVLEQFYNLKSIKYSIDIADYMNVIRQIGYEIYPFLKQAGEIKKKEELLSTISGVRATEVADVTKETKKSVLGLEVQKSGFVNEGETKDEI